MRGPEVTPPSPSPLAAGKCGRSRGTSPSPNEHAEAPAACRHSGMDLPCSDAWGHLHSRNGQHATAGCGDGTHGAGSRFMARSASAGAAALEGPLLCSVPSEQLPEVLGGSRDSEAQVASSGEDMAPCDIYATWNPFVQTQGMHGGAEQGYSEARPRPRRLRRIAFADRSQSMACDMADEQARESFALGHGVGDGEFGQLQQQEQLQQEQLQEQQQQQQQRRQQHRGLLEEQEQWPQRRLSAFSLDEAYHSPTNSNQVVLLPSPSGQTEASRKPRKLTTADRSKSFAFDLTEGVEWMGLDQGGSDGRRAGWMATGEGGFDGRYADGATGAHPGQFFGCSWKEVIPNARVRARLESLQLIEPGSPRTGAHGTQATVERLQRMGYSAGDQWNTGPPTGEPAEQASPLPRLSSQLSLLPWNELLRRQLDGEPFCGEAGTQSPSRSGERENLGCQHGASPFPRQGSPGKSASPPGTPASSQGGEASPPPVLRRAATGGRASVAAECWLRAPERENLGCQGEGFSGCLELDSQRRMEVSRFLGELISDFPGLKRKRM